MANPSDIETRKAILRARGVPEKFVANLAGRRSKPVLLRFFFGAMFFMVACVACMFAGPQVDATLAPLLYPHPADSVMFYAPSALAMVPFFVGLAVVVGVMFLVFATLLGKIRPSPAFNPTAAQLATLRPKESLATLQPDTAYTKHGNLPDDTAFLTALRGKPASGFQIVACLMAFLPIFMMMAQQLIALSQYKILTHETVIVHDVKGATTYRLADASYAFVTCYGGPTPRFDYRLVYPARTISLWQFNDPVHHLDAVGVYNTLSVVDRDLTQLNIPIHRVPVAGSPGDDARDCVSTITRRWHMPDSHLMNSLVFGR